MGWRKSQDEDNRLRHRLSVLACTILGGIIGGAGGLFVCVYVLPDTLFFDGDTVLIGALGLGVPGYIYGEPFLDAVLDVVRDL